MEENYQVIPQFLRFTSNDGFGLVEWKADKQSLEFIKQHEQSSFVILQPTRLQWKAFWLLLDLANVWDWEPMYAPEGCLSCDEHQWSLRISRDGRYISTCGFEAYPGTHEKNYKEGSPYDVLRTAMEVLTSSHYKSSMSPDEVLTSPPHSFDFTLWSDAYENLGINIRWRKNGPGLQWQHVSNQEDEWGEMPAPSRLTWKAFCFLLDLAKVEKWDAEYASFTTAHAGWSFKAYINGQTIKSAGGDTYPNSEEGAGYLPGSPFDILVTALSLLIGKDVLGMRS